MKKKINDILMESLAKIYISSMIPSVISNNFVRITKHCGVFELVDKINDMNIC